MPDSTESSPGVRRPHPNLLKYYVLASLLYPLEPRDLIVFVSVPSALAFIGLVAVWVPARRASRVDPIEALRSE